MSYQSDLFEVILDLLIKFINYLILEPINLTERALNDIDLAAGQIAKMILFLIVFFSEYDAEGEIKFSFHPAKPNEDAQAYYTNLEWIGIAWLTNQIYLILFERQYVFNQFSQTFKRLLFHDIFGLFQNGFALYALHQEENIVVIFENIKKLGMLQIYAILFSINLFLDLLSLISLIVIKFCFKEKHKLKRNYVSYGGLRYFLGGFLIGLLFPTFIYLSYYLKEIKDKPKLNSQIEYDYRGNLILNFSCLGFQVFFLLFYVYQAYKEKEAEWSKKFLCLIYGISFGMMNTYNSAFIFVVVFLHYAFKISFFCFCIGPQQSCLWISFLYCCTPNIENPKYKQTETALNQNQNPNPNQNPNLDPYPDPVLTSLKS